MESISDLKTLQTPQRQELVRFLNKHHVFALEEHERGETELTIDA